jgi:Resolvase, N terminal domain
MAAIAKYRLASFSTTPPATAEKRMCKRRANSLRPIVKNSAEEQELIRFQHVSPDPGTKNLHAVIFLTPIPLGPDRPNRKIPTKTEEVVMPLHPRLTAKPSNCAAQYVRLSPQLQQYSPENQAEVIKRYAANHGLEIVKTYADHGRSGLNLSGREGLRELLKDVESGTAAFSAVLVYDVGRRGRAGRLERRNSIRTMAALMKTQEQKFRFMLDRVLISDILSEL